MTDLSPRHGSVPGAPAGSTAGEPYPRDLTGYGPEPPHPQWPGGARIAVSIVLNWEEGGENAVLHGDSASEAGGTDVVDARPYPGTRHMRVESMFEYGSRAGVWRLLRIFDRYRTPVTVFAVGMAVERSPETVRRMADAGHEICAHGYRWFDYQYVEPAVERDHIRRTVAAIEAATGERPVGWYTGRTSPQTRRLVVEEGGFLYDCDDYSDDLPFWTRVGDQPHLVVPYSLDANDMRFVSNAGFTSGEDFFRYLRDTFDMLYTEGATAPKMMSVGLHCRLAGRPGRAMALARFLEYAARHEGVWFARRGAIARHWQQRFPAAQQTPRGSR
ncbi:allantoinase PuuE [Actinacidiphila oryziradicis]|jgi:putative urate catabolism protein|uniref:allantoinase PuuE n=1 Tax=Actinacidiphila oryziradicis TaxID=2571141 RepID=UPI0023F1BD95|nr:allantoinase PuuE [Actinacidiphila oryziradicis]MCW2869637.1 allantoinase [Actinacidiphila oryziradicis]